MNIALRRAMTVPDFLAWASAQGEGPRTELINGQIVAMSPERAAHNRAKGAVFIALRRALHASGIAGEVFTDGLTVPIDEHTAYEPDALVRCGDPLPAHAVTATDPIVVVEVVSPSSYHTDTTAKLAGYFKIASVRHYLVVDPDAKSVMHHARANDGALSVRVLTAGTVRLDPPGLVLNGADLLG